MHPTNSRFLRPGAARHPRRGSVARGVLLLTVLSLAQVMPQRAVASSSTQTQPTEAMIVARQGHTATVLADGRVLIVGGRDTNGVLNAAEVFDPSTKLF